jgi:S1-C subfamily serine protease
MLEVCAAIVLGVVLGVVAHLGWSPDAASGAPVQVAGISVERGAVQSGSAAVERVAASAVVEVHVDGCGVRRQGSATLIRRSSGEVLLLTNAHVVRGATRVTVDLPGGASTGSDVMGALSGRDAALLDPEPLLEAGLEPAVQGVGVTGGSPVAVAGFPAGTFDVRSAAVVDVQRRAGYGGATDVLLVGTTAVGGHSGGALLAPDGSLVGVVAARDPSTRDVVAYPIGELLDQPLAGPVGC